jgi:hypothetical protein
MMSPASMVAPPPLLFPDSIICATRPENSIKSFLRTRQLLLRLNLQKLKKVKKKKIHGKGSTQ